MTAAAGQPTTRKPVGDHGLATSFLTGSASSTAAGDEAVQAQLTIARLQQSLATITAGTGQEIPTVPGVPPQHQPLLTQLQRMQQRPRPTLYQASGGRTLGLSMPLLS